MSTSLRAFLAFGRETDSFYDPWWPLYADDGPHMAESAEACIALMRERLALGGEGDWVEIAAVPADGWIERRR